MGLHSTDLLQNPYTVNNAMNVWEWLFKLSIKTNVYIMRYIYFFKIFISGPSKFITGTAVPYAFQSIMKDP